MNKTKLIVADYNYTNLLFTYKNNNPSFNIKFITRKELIEKLSFSYDDSAIAYLLSLNISYKNAKNYLKLLQVANINKSQKLLDLYNQIKDFLTYDDLGKYELSLYDIVLFESKNDREIQALLDRNHLCYSFLSIEDIGATKYLDIEKISKEIIEINDYNKKNESKKEIPSSYKFIKYFDNKYMQYSYIFSDIRKRILEDESIKNKIKILVKDDYDVFYIKQLSSVFDIPCFVTILSPYISKKQIKDKINQIHSSRSFVFSEEDLKDAYLKNFKGIIDTYHLDTLDFDFAYASLLEIISSLSFNEPNDSKGILVTTRFDFNPESIIYVTNFEYGSFYSSFDDKNVLTDKELLEVEANTSYFKTDMDRNYKLNFLKYNNIVLVSRVLQHLTDAIFHSQFVDEFKIKSCIDKVKINLDGIYTSKANDLYTMDYLDKQFYKDPYQIYNSYDHSFKGIQGEVVKKDQTWSITNLEKYIECPYQYYLNTVIPIQADEKYPAWFGTFNHALFERIYHEDFDFEKEFENAKNKYKDEMAKSSLPYTCKEEAWLECAKKWLKMTASVILESKQYMNKIDRKDDYEVKTAFDLYKGDNVYHFAGRIDKILYTEANGKKYYTLIDYKSGAEKYKIKQVFLGKSTQLPLYAYSLSLNKDFEDYTFGGFGIQTTFASNPKKFSDGASFGGNTIKKLMKISGVYFNAPDYLKSIDATGFNKEKITKATYFDNSNTFSSLNKEAEDKLAPKSNIKYSYYDMIQDAINATIETIEKILNNQFPIVPTTRDLEDGKMDKIVCSYCGYKDICYHNKYRDGVSYKKIIMERFPKEVKEVSENDERL